MGIFPRDFFKPILLALKRPKINFMLCSDLIWGYISMVKLGDPGKSRIKSMQYKIIYKFWTESPNSNVDIYPQMGSKHNVKLIFGLSPASRCGLQKISMKNSHANSFSNQNKNITPARIWAVKLRLDSFKLQKN